ncbi:MAG: DUF1489 domain-containing protein [Alphaproteobacteria bacterium]|nr:DUF1489 domain-containing protein [Alphaproteobacteria bacterium]
MMLHLKKLCVGVESSQHLREWQAQRRKQVHVTRNFPRRAEEIIAQGSLYWIIKGRFSLRQKIIDLQDFTYGNNKRCCRIVMDDTLVSVRGDRHRPFQGWRYLEVENVPPDAHIDDTGEMVPEDVSAMLDQLGIRALQSI